MKVYRDTVEHESSQAAHVAITQILGGAHIQFTVPTKLERSHGSCGLWHLIYTRVDVRIEGSTG